jgi:hypothetical protein
VFLKKWVYIKNDMPIKNNEIAVSVTESSQLKGVKRKIRERKWRQSARGVEAKQRKTSEI